MPVSITLPVMTCDRSPCTTPCTIQSSDLYKWSTLISGSGYGFTNVVAGTSTVVADVEDPADLYNIYIKGTTNIGTVLTSPLIRFISICGPVALASPSDYVQPVFGINSGSNPTIWSGTY